MLDADIFVQTFLPVLVGVLASFLLWFGGQWLVGYLRDRKAKVALLREIEDEIVINMDSLDNLVRGISDLLDQQAIPVHIPHRMRLEVSQYVVQSGEIRLITDINKQRLIRYIAYVCNIFNDFIDNTEVVLTTLIGRPNAEKLARQRLTGLMEQAAEHKKVLSRWLKELQGESLTKESKLPDNLMRKFVVSQAPTYFFASFLFIRLTGLAQEGGVSGYHKGCIAVGALLLVWAFILCVDAWRGQRVFRKVAEVMELPYWIISVTVFGVGLVTNLVALIQTGIGSLYFYIFYFAGIVLLILMLIHFVQSSRQK